MIVVLSKKQLRTIRTDPLVSSEKAKTGQMLQMRPSQKSITAKCKRPVM